MREWLWFFLQIAGFWSKLLICSLAHKKGVIRSKKLNKIMFLYTFLCVSHTPGCGVLDTTPAPENNVAICPGGEKKKKKKYIYIKYVFCKFFKKSDDSLIPSFLLSNVSNSLRLLMAKEQPEQIVQVAHQKWVTMSDSLRSLTKKEWPWAGRSGHSFFAKMRAIRSENQWANSQPWI